MQHHVKIGNFLVHSPNGVAFVVDDQAAFAFDPGGDYFAGTAAPDNSYHLTHIGDVKFEWGRLDDAIVGRLTSTKDQDLTIKLLQTWPGWKTKYQAEPEGAIAMIGSMAWRIAFQPEPVRTSPEQIEIHLEAGKETTLVAEMREVRRETYDPQRVKALKAEILREETVINLGYERVSIDHILDKAKQAYEQRRPKAIGDWGNFVGAIADNLNNSRIYSSDDKRVAISVSRGWASDPNSAPYFCWDSFFNGALACLDDPQTARETVRAILSWQTPEGLVPNFGHWKFGDQRASDDRSQPPVGSMCVWKMEQRWPDRDFLQEVYPKLLKWHRWWPTARDGQHDGLLEWGSSAAGRQGALWETGWDDTVHFDGAEMSGNTLDAYAVDLNSLWVMDAEYLARIAEFLGKTQDAKELREERQRTIKLINDKLWNPDLGLYCSRLWNGTFLTRITPMNFYPLIAGIPDKSRAKQVLNHMTDPKKFWGDWVLPTVAYDDPVWTQQNYWRGKVWAPVNFLVFQGLQRYASPEIINAFADKSVRLFMHNWTAMGVCGENYLSSTGEQSSDPHYTWGALLCLIGIESVCHTEPDGTIVLNGTTDKTLHIDNLPIFGRSYELDVTPHHTVLKLDGQVVAKADNGIARLVLFTKTEQPR